MSVVPSLSVGVSVVAEFVKDDAEPSKHFPPIFLACVTCVELVLFAFTMIVNQGFETFDHNNMLGPSTKTLYLCGGLHLGERQYWRLLSNVFLHAGVFHVVPNVAVQWWAGCAVEALWGFKRTAILYLLSGLGGSLLSANLSFPTNLTVGASGAVHGLMAVVAAGNGSQLWWPSSFRLVALELNGLTAWLGSRSMIAFLVVSVGSGAFTPGVDNWAHVGGTVAGIAFAAACTSYRGRRRRLIQGFALLVLLGFFVIGIYLLGCYDCYEHPGQLAQILL